MSDQAGPSDLLVSLLPLLLIMTPLAVGNFFLAKRVDKNRALWAILSLIPVFNFLFFYYVGYIVVFRVLDRLNQATSPDPHSASG